ncbi:MAG: hypothetical protein RIB46_15740 [Pseudomonadales bacterium]
MWIRRLAVAHWRGLSYALEGLAPGLNLIAGPNESGKSRLVEALRFAFFESTSGQAAHKKQLATWGLAPDKPRVSVSFELAGTDWQLDKVFLDRGWNARLRGGREDLEGEAAEARLAELLGVRPGSGRTEARLADQGIWSLLWVDQGASRDLPAHNAEAQNRLLDALTREVGEVAAGAFGQRILARATEQVGRYYTEKTFAERPLLKDARAEVARLAQAADEAAAARAAIAEAADALQQARDKAADLGRRHDAATTLHRQLQARLQDAEQARHELRLQDAALREADGERRSAAERLAQAETLAEEVRTLGEQVAALTERSRDTDAETAVARQGFDAASAELTTLEQQADAAAAALTRLRRMQALSSQRQQLTRQQQRLDAARQRADRRATLQGELDALPALTPADVKRLRRAAESRTTAFAQLEGASVALELTARRDVVIDGVPLAAGASTRILVTDERQIDIDQAVSLTVSPGAGELTALRDAVRDAERQLAALRDELQVADAEAADQVVQRRTALTADIERLAADLAEQVPEGLDELARQVQALRAGIEAASAAAAGAAAEDGAEDEAVDGAEALAAAEQRQRALAEQCGRARAARDAAQERWSQLRALAARHSSALEAAVGQHRQRQQQLAAQPALDTLRAAVDTATRMRDERANSRDAAQRRYQDSGGDQLAEDVARAAQAEAALAQALQSTRDTCLRLETTLAQAPADARHERVQEIEAELAAARDALERLLRDAAAARRLFEVLDAEYRAARERLAQPVIERIRPYLADLFPGTEVWLDEALNLQGLRGADAAEAFELLSGGAREQLALLVRIGLAEVLGQEEPWPLVLDDVLVNTDAERVRRMQRALFHAGRHMQILLFTCHGTLFDALGPDTWIELPAPRTTRGS